MQVLRVSESSGVVQAVPALLPYRHALDKGPSDVIPAAAFWMARLAASETLQFPLYGSHLLVVLSGELTLEPAGSEPVRLLPGHVLCCDVTSPGALRATWPRDVWVLLISAPGWQPDEGILDVSPVGEPRPGRPSMTWIYDDSGYSRSEPFRWPYPVTTVPDLAQWPTSVGAFITRRDYGLDGFHPGVWHNGPRRQFAITLNGCAELVTSDGSVSRPVPGDLTLIDDTTGPGHVTHGQGDRWMLFLTVGPGELAMQPEV